MKKNLTIFRNSYKLLAAKHFERKSCRLFIITSKKFSDSIFNKYEVMKVFFYLI